MHLFHSRLYYPVDAGLLPLTVYVIAGGQFEALAPYVQTSEANTEPS